MICISLKSETPALLYYRDLQHPSHPRSRRKGGADCWDRENPRLRAPSTSSPSRPWVRRAGVRPADEEMAKEEALAEAGAETARQEKLEQLATRFNRKAAPSLRLTSPGGRPGQRWQGKQDQGGGGKDLQDLRYLFPNTTRLVTCWHRQQVVK